MKISEIINVKEIYVDQIRLGSQTNSLLGNEFVFNELSEIIAPSYFLVI